MASRACAVRSAMRSSTRAAGAGGLQQPAQRVELLGAGVGVAQHVGAAAAPGVVGPLLGEGDQQGLLALAQVVVGGLAGDRGVAEHAEDVVPELERLARAAARSRCSASTTSGPAPAMAAPSWSGRCTV